MHLTLERGYFEGKKWSSASHKTRVPRCFTSSDVNTGEKCFHSKRSFHEIARRLDFKKYIFFGSNKFRAFENNPYPPGSINEQKWQPYWCNKKGHGKSSGNDIWHKNI